MSALLFCAGFQLDSPNTFKSQILSYLTQRSIAARVPYEDPFFSSNVNVCTNCYMDYFSCFQITSLWIYEILSIPTSMSKNTSSPPSSACCSQESCTVGCVGSSCTLSRLPCSRATSLSSKPFPGKASTSCSPTTRPSPSWTSDQLQLRWWVLQPSACSDSGLLTKTVKDYTAVDITQRTQPTISRQEAAALRSLKELSVVQ